MSEQTHKDAAKIAAELAGDPAVELRVLRAIKADLERENAELRSTLGRIADGASKPLTPEYPEAMIRAEIEDLARTVLARI